ncbi:DUF1735 domain-containing protein [Sphingobacterium sp.]|uniref:DUF1735 domain-containing protein n=1 Tax=Sphingobacterium sp. TaxID=341027 RepID=UPI0031E1A883
MKINKIILKRALLYAAALSFALSSCKDEALNFDDPAFSSLLYLGTVGEVPVEFYNVNQDITYSTFIGKGGTSTDISREAKLKVWTAEELDTYNKSTGTNYRLLPADYYTLEMTYAFDTKDERKPLQVILKKNIGQLERNVDYVLPIELTSANYTINKNYTRLFLKPVIITPKISLDNTAKQDAVNLSIRDNKVTTAQVKTALMVNMKNQGWSFGVSFEDNESKLASLVQEYKTIANDGINYQLLPKANYSIPEVAFTGSENKKEIEVSINRKGLAVGNYLLPLSLKAATGMPFDVSNEVRYIPVKITDEIPKIQMTVSNLFANSTDGNSLPNIINGQLDDSGWQSEWYNAGISKPISDPKYGIYIDLKNLSISAAARLILTIKTTHNNPKHIQIYGGTSESNLKLIHENSNCYPNSATNKKYDTGVLESNGITMLRIAFLSNVNNVDMRTLQFYSGSYIQNVSMAEVELFGL